MPLFPKLDFFNSIGLSSSDIAKHPLLLLRGLKSHIIRTFSFLKGLVKSDEKTVVAINRYLFVRTLYCERDMAKEARDVGFDPSKRIFVAGMSSLMSMSKSTWEKKDKIMAVMDLFVNKLDWESSVLMAFSLEKRLVFWATVLEFLVLKGLVWNFYILEEEVTLFFLLNCV
ncbi:hypothetical protein NC653_022453 [Populus alba x Populus x berolinensis]|uniref:Uncharacterized protein n=1 Tax=Populus alba x Populus x berolinensis TaxID=444605 RepID=A0AAD6MF67_9ROSI|nr:hypothetical protein NC653_022453 [Populus alba x Populus x berolinensis]